MIKKFNRCKLACKNCKGLPAQKNKPKTLAMTVFKMAKFELWISNQGCGLSRAFQWMTLVSRASSRNACKLQLERLGYQVEKSCTNSSASLQAYLNSGFGSSHTHENREISPSIAIHMFEILLFLTLLKFSTSSQNCFLTALLACKASLQASAVPNACKLRVHACGHTKNQISTVF